MVRLLALASALFATAALAASSDQSVRRDSSSSGGTLPQQTIDHLRALARRQQQHDAAVIKQMPVDYRDCVLPVLVRLMGQAGRNNLYVEVFDHDMDTHLQAALAGYGIAAHPYSAMPKWGQSWGIKAGEHPPIGLDPTHTSYWAFSVGDIIAESPGRYSVDAGDMCGSLCGGRYRFSLKVVGKRCVITSMRAMVLF